MKYTLLLFFLIAFANSKLPTESLNSLLENLNSDEDRLKCIPGSTSKDICVNIKLDDQNNQCCYLDMAFENKTEKACQQFPKDLGDYTNVINAKQFKPLTKEIYGYIKYSLPDEVTIPDIPEIKAQVICKDGVKLDVDIGGDKYTEEEIKILKSEDYCLNYTVSAFIEKDKTFDCKNGKLLQSSKDAGIECGDLSVNIKFGTNETTYKTCMLFSYDMFSKINIPNELKGIVQKNIKEYAKGAEKVTIELSDSQGHKVTYDTDTGNIVNNNSSILTISKYLFLLTLFLF